MRVLVDEGMPVQVLPPLRLNKRHEFDHIDELKWKGKQWKTVQSCQKIYLRI